jgi:predicted flap endonuclease-1-like 5' DNA nuclease
MDWLFAILWLAVGAALSWGGERLVRRLRGEKDRAMALASENAAHLFRIKSLESEASLIPGLRAKIADLESRPPTIVEKPVVKMVERPFDNTATMTRLQSLEKDAARIPDLKARIAELEARPPKIVDRVVDNPAHLARITALEAEVAIIPDLKSKIVALEARAPEVVEKIVERPVDNPAHLARIRRLEEEVEVIPDLRARIAELEQRPPEIVERPVEKIVDRLVDNPVHVARIRALEKEAGLVPSLRGRIAELEARASKFDMSAYGRPVERIIERLVPDMRASEESDRRLKELERRFATLERAIGRVNGAPEAAQLAGADADAPTAGLVDVAAARAEGFNMWGPDDLRILSGLDDEAADILSAAGASTFATLAEMTPAEIRQVLKSSRGAVEPSEAETWPEEAALVLRNDWRGLKALQQSRGCGG